MKKSRVDVNKNNERPRITDVLIGTACGAGYWPWGPGTAGALVATILWWISDLLITDYHIVTLLTVALIIAVTLLSIHPINRLERHWGSDPSKVVIDEVVGVWITLLAIPEQHEWWRIVSAFLLFRFFDILKPLGVRRMERINGGWGVMLDDILAGTYGGIILLIVERIIT